MYCKSVVLDIASNLVCRLCQKIY